MKFKEKCLQYPYIYVYTYIYIYYLYIYIIHVGSLFLLHSSLPLYREVTHSFSSPAKEHLLVDGWSSSHCLPAAYDVHRSPGEIEGTAVKTSKVVLGERCYKFWYFRERLSSTLRPIFSYFVKMSKACLCSSILHLPQLLPLQNLPNFFCVPLVFCKFFFGKFLHAHYTDVSQNRDTPK